MYMYQPAIVGILNGIIAASLTRLTMENHLIEFENVSIFLYTLIALILLWPFYFVRHREWDSFAVVISFSLGLITLFILDINGATHLFLFAVYKLLFWPFGL